MKFPALEGYRLMNFDISTPTRLKSLKEAGKPATSRSEKRNGLAPLEMVLALPLLMGVMGLLMVFGFVASWKVRSEVVAKDIGWRNRYPRGRNIHQRSEEWPELEGENRSLDLHRTDAGNLESVDAQPVVHAQIIRGPISEIVVNSQLLDFSKGVTRGVATVNQPSQIMGEIGRADYRTTNEFVSGSFSYPTIGGGNYSRRIPILWDTQLDDLYDQPGVSDLINAINDLRDPIVLPIDEDMEFYTWNLRLLEDRIVEPSGNETLIWERWDSLPAWPDPRSYVYIRDFSRLGESDWDEPRQRRRGFREISPTPSCYPSVYTRPRRNTRHVRYEEGRDSVRDTIVEAYLDQIPQVPLSMASRTRQLYQTVLDYHERDHVEPRLTLQERKFLEKSVEELQQYITELSDRE